MTDHPYRSQPSRAFWSRAVATDYAASDAVTASRPLLQRGDRVASAGSCFASNMIPWLEAAELEYVRTEQRIPSFAHIPENLGYQSFSAAYGNIYTARHLRHLLERMLGLFTPEEDRWHEEGHVIDPFRPGLRHPARSDGEFDLLTAQHLAAVRKAFGSATVLVFTLGLTEGWESVADGAVYPACPGTIAGTFDPSRHRFHNFSAEEVREDLKTAVHLLRRENPELRVILTVSPVPLVATATNEHVLTATIYSKSVLRVAAAEVAASMPSVTYFPAYEIVTGPQAPHDYFAEDRRSVTDAGVSAVMEALLANSELQDRSPVSSVPSTVPAHNRVLDGVDVAGELSRRVAEAECDEVLTDT